MVGLAPELAAAQVVWVLDQAVLPADVHQVGLFLELGEARRDAGEWEAGGDASEAAARRAVAVGRSDQLTPAAEGFVRLATRR